MNRFSLFRGFHRNSDRRQGNSRARAKRQKQRLGRLEHLEDRRLLTWYASFANGSLIIQAQGLSSDTGVLKVDPSDQEILLDPNNKGNFVDTGASLATITGTIQIDAGTSVNSNFIIDNNAGAFFEASATFPAGTPLFNYTGSTALNPNASLTIRGVGGVAESFEVALDPTSNGGAANTTGISTGEAGVAVLTEPPTPLNQRDQLTVTFGPNATVPNSTGITGHLNFDGINSAGGDTLFVDDQGATINPITPGLPAGTPTASNWTLTGNQITGPQFPSAPTSPPFSPGTVGDIKYANIANVQFNDATAGDLLTINSVAANTTASDAVANYTVVNYQQPLAYPVNIVGVGTQVASSGSSGGQNNATGGELDIVGAQNGGNNFYINANTVALAPAGVKPQYNTPFAHQGADLTYTADSLKTMSVAGNGGNNTFTIQVPPTQAAPYPSDTLAPTFNVYGGAMPPPKVLIGAKPPFVLPGTDLLRVFGTAPGGLSTGADSITVQDLAGGANNGGNNNTTGGTISMSQITAVVLYGEGGNDTLTNNSKGNPATGQKPVPALFIPGNGNSTMVGGAGSDMFLGGSGQYTITSNAAINGAQVPTTYFFPHQDQFGNIYDPLLDPSLLDTTSTLNGTTGNQVVVTGQVDPLASTAINPLTGNAQGDLDAGNLANTGTGTTGGGGTTTPTGQTQSFATVPPTNVTAPLYTATDALIALEDAMGIGKGQFPANTAALLEFGGKLNLRTQFASPAAFVGRAYNDFLIDRGGGGTFGSAQGSGNGGVPGISGGTSVGGATVSPAEINYGANLIKNGLSLQVLQADILASDELRQTLPNADSWGSFLYQAVTGEPFMTAQQQAQIDAVLGHNDTMANRFAIAMSVLTSPAGQAAEIDDAYANVVPGGGKPSSTDLVAIEADLASGESLPQVAQVMGQSDGNYLAYEMANGVGTVGFVANVYQSTLHRPASTGDLLYWANQRGAGFTDQLIAQAVLNSPEAKRYVIINAYEKFLGRAPDPGSMNFWQAQLAAGLSDEGFISIIAASPEYYARNASSTPTPTASYITALYRDVLGRAPSQQDIVYWATQLGALPNEPAQARANIAFAILGSPEYHAQLVNGWYRSFDGRAPTGSELQSALQLFNSGASDEQVAASILVQRATS